MCDFVIKDLDPIQFFYYLNHKDKIFLEDTLETNKEHIREEEILMRLNEELEIKKTEPRQLFDIISKPTHGICIIQKNGLISWANNSFIELSDMSSDQLIGHVFLNLPILQYLTTANRQKIVEQMEVFATFDIEICILKSNELDETKWYEINFQPLLNVSMELVNYLVFFRDITFKKATTSQMAQLSGNLTTIFQLCPDGFISFDKHGIQTYSNASLYRLTGLDPSKISRISIIEFEAIISEISLKVSKLSDSTTTLVFKQHKTTIIKRTTKQSLDSHGQLISTIQYFKDITYEYEMEQMKSNFLSMAAHELRTPMSSIHGYTELLINRDFPVFQQKEMILTIYRQTTRMIEMLNDLLDLEKIETKGVNALTIKNHNLVDIIREVSKEFAIDLKIDLRLPNQPVHIMADRDKIMRAIENLLSNAKKYSPSASVVEVVLTSTTSSGMTRITIKDYGCGISPANMKKLFTKFFRADNSGKTSGTGLGLCIVKEIIELHGGRIEISSEFGQGTVVNLTLPSVSTD
jgi:signal transduction histidine kinase